jgi:hypothetical protein
MDKKTFRKFSATKSYNKETRSASATIATEKPVRVYDFMSDTGFIDEVLIMDGAVLPDSGQIPLLDSHNQSSVRNILGSCRNLRIEGDRLAADLFFADTNAGKMLENQVRDGHLTDLSIGAAVIEFENIPDGQSKEFYGRLYQGPLRVVTQWEPMEASAVAIGADKYSTIRQRGKNMDTDTTTTTTTDTQNPQGQHIAGGADALMAERQRVAEIYQICRSPLGDFKHFAEQFVRDGVSPDEARKKVMEHLARTNPPIGPGAIRIESTGMERAENAIIDGLVMRTGTRIEKPAPGAQDFRHASLVDIARFCLSENYEFAHRARAMSPSQVIKTAMVTRAAGSHTTSDFPYILANVGNKVLRNAWDNHPATFEAWTAKGEGRDFKEMSRVQLSEAPDLLEVGEGGEYKAGSFSEDQTTFSIRKYGRMFRISFEAMVNDDTSAFSRIPQAFVKAAKRSLNSLVYSKLTGNPNMADGVALFHASHSNIETTSLNIGVVDTDNLSAARHAMRLQTGLQTDDPLNISPKFLIIPSAQETTADIILNSTALVEDDKSSGVNNPWRGKLIPIVEPLLDSTSEKAWYLAADPRLFDTIEVCYLDGIEHPYIESRDSFYTDTWEFKIRLCYAVAPIDHRGLFMNPGEEDS